MDTDYTDSERRLIWHHALAILYTRSYLLEHAAAVRANWPRIPLPATLQALQDSAALGATVGQLLDVEKPVLGVTAGKLRKELNLLGRITGPRKGLSLKISAGWGHAHKERDIVMPGRGVQKRRDFAADEKAAIDEGAKDLGLAQKDVVALWGSKTLDIYIFTSIMDTDIVGLRI